MGHEVLLGVEVSLGPLAGRHVRAQGEHEDACREDDDQGHDESQSPGLTVAIPARVE